MKKNKLFILSSLLCSSLYASNDIEYKLRGIAAVVNNNMNNIEMNKVENKSIQENLESIEKNIDLLKNDIKVVHEFKDNVSFLKDEIEQLKNNDKENKIIINEIRNNISSLLKAPKNINISETRILKNDSEHVEQRSINLLTDITNNVNENFTKHYVNAKEVHVRKIPSSNSKTLAVFTYNDEISIVDCDKFGWCKISAPLAGYVPKYLIGGF